MTAWALSEARSQGYPVGAEFLDHAVRWTKDRFVPRFSAQRDPRPGWNLVSVPAIYLGAMSQTLPILSRDEINQVAVHLAAHQEEDGAWLPPPPSNGAPPIWESRETLALWALLAWEPHVPADPQAAAAALASREKAMAWLASTTPSNTTQARALRLLLDVRLQKGEQLPRIDELLKQQNADGGWSQTPDLASDAYATGQALYALSFAGVKHDRPEIQRAVSLLVASQKEDGSWPMTSRNHPGVETTRNPIRNPVPITYFGSAWGVLGLVRSVPMPPDSPAKQQHAFDEIKKFHGKYDVDDKSPGDPVRIDLRYYDVSDQEVENLTKVLQAFPRLEALDLKSAKITDSGLPHLQNLPQLRRLVLEAAVTDAGLMHLRSLLQLEELSLKGTKVTDAGVQELQKALPRLKVNR
jgi:squalene-hopene cyclase-like protein